eukprot:TRINITY_DN7535_c0_g2_i1.p1 TRINITY_DN7535_c0_g2~~TRINITY_DN7535_c0_g2_i1.p1  ORF type:complete len:215 (+),score=48.54 TRINITY_DN7535_c0_g2_i1:69-713(+)
MSSIEEKLIRLIAKRGPSRRSAIRREVGVDGADLTKVLKQYCVESDGCYALKGEGANPVQDEEYVTQEEAKASIEIVEGMWTGSFMPPSSAVACAPSAIMSAAIAQEPIELSAPPSDIETVLHKAATKPLPVLPPSLIDPHHYFLFVSVHGDVAARLDEQRALLKACNPTVTPPWSVHDVAALHEMDKQMLDMLAFISKEVAAYTKKVRETQQR